MPAKTIDFEIADLNLTQQDEDYPELALSATVTYDVHPAEPDVGIFGSQYDVTEWEFMLDGTSYTSQYEFACRLYGLIGHNIGECEDELNQAITAWSDHEFSRIEQDDD